MKKVILHLLAAGMLLWVGCDSSTSLTPEEPSEKASSPSESFLVAASRSFEEAELQLFMPSGDVHSLDEEGNAVLCSDENPCALEPGVEYPPTNGSRSRLWRGDGWIGYIMRTSGLPPGAYTNWWVVFNHPEFCEDGPPLCDIDDLFFNPDVNGSVYWSTGGIVQEGGIGNFKALTREGEVPDGEGQLIWGEGLEAGQAGAAVIHLIVKYHGPASEDPDILYDQTHTLLGHCDQGVNGFLDAGIVQCFDPQFAVHVPEEE